MTTLATRIIDFYQSLHLDASLPEGVEVLNPFDSREVEEICATFYQKYYNDNDRRKIIIGINPGRFGGGITGIPFTDPIRLQSVCGVANSFKKVPELSSDFIYKVIEAWGGCESFYVKFFITAVSPLGFTKGGKNLNYYDIRALKEAIEPFAINCMGAYKAMGLDVQKVFCLGEGENYKYLQGLNSKLRLFETIVPLPHPRFIMQYRRKRLAEYIQLYVDRLG